MTEKCLRLASNNSAEADGFISLRLRIGRLREKVGSLVVPGLSTNMLVSTAFIRRYTKRISLEAETTNPVKLRPVTTAEAAEGCSALNVEKNEHRERVEAPRVIARSVRLSPMSETPLRVKTFAAGIHLVESGDNLAGTRQVLVAKGIVYTASEAPFDIKEENLSISYIKLPKDMKAAKCSLVPLIWSAPTMKEEENDNVNAVQIFEAQKSMQELIDDRYGTTKKDASLQENH